ncbi:MAG: DinB family protein [bacterium]
MNAPDDQDAVLARYLEGPALLERAIAGIQDSDLDAAPSQGGWTIREIVHHIVDGDYVWTACVKMALGNEQAEFSLEWYWALTQDDWASRWAYADRSVGPSMALLEANRRHVAHLLEKVPDGWHRSVGFRKHNGETERVPIGAAIEIQADHVVHHVNRIRAIRSEIDNA